MSPSRPPSPARRRVGPLALAALALCVLAAGCGAPEPMEGPRLARLKEEVARAAPGKVRLFTVGPKLLADGGQGATIALRFVDRMPPRPAPPPTGTATIAT